MTRSSEQQSASAWQEGGDFRDQSALGFRVQQKEKAPGEHTIKSSTEEVRILYSYTLIRTTEVSSPYRIRVCRRPTKCLRPVRGKALGVLRMESVTERVGNNLVL